MRRLFLAVPAIALPSLIVLSSSAQEAAKAPETVGPFIAYCRTDFTGCSSKIAEGELEQTMDDLTHKTNKACVIPTGVMRKQGVADIVNWLAKHPETASMSVLDGAKAAARGLWNCETKVKTGITSGGAPDATGR
jgi:hypothetical protein